MSPMPPLIHTAPAPNSGPGLRLRKRARARGYTLVEALVASSVLLVGISAAASMSLALVTQEEINENTVRAANHLDNAARLVQLGMPPASIPGLLPAEPVVASLSFSQRTINLPEVGSVPATTVTVVYRPTGAVAENRGQVLEWTGGDAGAERSASVEVVSAGSFQSGPPPRINHFQ